MMRSVIAAVAMVFLAACPAAAQITNYFLAPPPSGVAAPHPPPAQIPDVPFAAVGNVPLVARMAIAKDFQLGPWAPLWLGSQAVALLGTRHGSITLLAYSGNHFAASRVLADPATVEGGTILDMALSRDGKRLAIAAQSGDKMQVWLRDTRRAAAAEVVATIDGTFDKAGLSWLSPNTLALGTGTETGAPGADPPPAIQQIPPNAEPTPQPAHSLYIVQIGAQGAPLGLDVDCLPTIDPTTLSWSPDAHYAVAQTQEQGKWTLIDRIKPACEPISIPQILPVGFIEWKVTSAGFLFSAAPVNSPDQAHVGVMEYSLTTRKARLLASPATGATYVANGGIAVLGSQRLNAAVMATNPGLLLPADIAWIDPHQSQMNIVPLGVSITAAELLSARLHYCPVREMVATSLEVPSRAGLIAVLLWMSTTGRNGGILATGKMGRMLPSWSPDGNRLAVLAGIPNHPTLAIVGAPR
jgi:hypothetical protein